MITEAEQFARANDEWPACNWRRVECSRRGRPSNELIPGAPGALAHAMALLMIMIMMTRTTSGAVARLALEMAIRRQTSAGKVNGERFV